MIAADVPAESARPPEASTGWQVTFLELLPMIRRHAEFAFRTFHGDDFDDAVQEVIANAMVAYARLAEQGRTAAASATSLVRYAVAQYWAGRRVGTRSNIHDVTSAYARRQTGVRIESLHVWDADDQAWNEILVEDRTVTPAELAASRLDVPAWLASLAPRKRDIAMTLARSESTYAVAREFRVSPARISQLRRELHNSWEAFHL